MYKEIIKIWVYLIYCTLENLTEQFVTVTPCNSSIQIFIRCSHLILSLLSQHTPRQHLHVCTLCLPGSEGNELTSRLPGDFCIICLGKYLQIQFNFIYIEKITTAIASTRFTV